MLPLLQMQPQQQLAQQHQAANGHHCQRQLEQHPTPSASTLQALQQQQQQHLAADMQQQQQQERTLVCGLMQLRAGEL
jgi:hypothetical protein